MTIGEISQNFDRFKIGTIENYIEKTQNKTAYLLKLHLLCPVLLSENTHDIKKSANLAYLSAHAFQIRDDILNFTQNDPLKPAIMISSRYI